MSGWSVKRRLTRLQLGAFDERKSTSWPNRVTNQCRADQGQRDDAEKVIKKLSSANVASFHTEHIEGDSLVRVPKAQCQRHQVPRAGWVRRAPWSTELPQKKQLKYLYANTWFDAFYRNSLHNIGSLTCCSIHMFGSWDWKLCRGLFL